MYRPRATPFCSANKPEPSIKKELTKACGFAIIALPHEEKKGGPHGEGSGEPPFFRRRARCGEKKTGGKKGGEKHANGNRKTGAAGFAVPDLRCEATISLANPCTSTGDSKKMLN